MAFAMCRIRLRARRSDGREPVAGGLPVRLCRDVTRLAVERVQASCEWMLTM